MSIKCIKRYSATIFNLHCTAICMYSYMYLCINGIYVICTQYCAMRAIVGRSHCYHLKKY